MMNRFFWQGSLDGLLEQLASRPEGLSEPEVQLRFKQYGPNQLAQARLDGELRQFLAFFANPLVLILLVAAAASAFFGELANAVIIGGIILASVTLNFLQTHRSQQAAESLRRSVFTQADVLRDGTRQSVHLDQVVPGDVFLLSAGDIVPADGRLLESKDLFVDQASLTGESLPAEKHVVELDPSKTDLDEATNAVFAGTSVISGTARAVAVHIGRSTQVGKISRELSKQPPPTEFERGMASFSLMILRSVFGLVLLVFLTLALIKHEPLEAFMFSIALAVGLTPEFLPMIITVTLSRGAVRMAKERVIVKQLQAIENFGSIDVLCSDKTGTLTEGRIVLERYVDALGEDEPDVQRAAVLNSYHETGIRSPLDEAILRAPHPVLADCIKLDEIPFDFHRRRLSVVLKVEARRVLIAKGAPEAILESCSHYRMKGLEHPLDDSSRAAIRKTFERLSLEGLRVLALAERSVPEKAAYEQSDECELTFLGFAAFLDPPRADVIETLRALKEDGIRVVILTGDNEWVTHQVCASVGIDCSDVILGHQLDAIGNEALPRFVERHNIYARMNPEQKDRVVRAMKTAGHVVGYLGDGINDAPSLRVADVGISVDTAVDVAKESAQIILMDKNLAVLHRGVMEGRRSFANVIKYVMMGTSSNFGNMFSMAAAAAILPFLPMLPLQILLNNLLYDVSQIALPGDLVDEEALSHSRRWNIRFIQSFMLHLGPVSSVFDLLTFAILLWVFHTPAALFHTGWFVESILTQTLVVFIIRTRFNPFRSRPSKGLFITVCSVSAIGLMLPYSCLASPLGFTPLPRALLFAILGLTFGYLALAEGMKQLFYKRLNNRSDLAGSA